MNKNLTLLLVTASTLTGLSVQAVDLVASGDLTLSWDRGDPNSGYAHWHDLPFSGATLNAGSGGGTPVVGYVGADAAGFFPEAPYTLYDGLSTVTGGPEILVTGGLLEEPYTFEITMPNIVDDLPMKLWHIQIHFDGVEPTLIGGQAHDSLAPPIFIPTTIDYGTAPVPGLQEFIGGYSSTVAAPLSEVGEVALYEGYILPNPDWETFVFEAEAATEVFQVTVDTISLVPEPSTYALLAGLAVLAVAAARRRR